MLDALGDTVGMSQNMVYGLFILLPYYNMPPLVKQ